MNYTEKISGSDRQEQPKKMESSSSYDCYTLSKGGVRGKANEFECVLTNGERYTFLYNYVVTLHYIPGGIIEVKFTNSKLTIKGRNIEEIYNFLKDRKITCLRVLKESDLEKDDDILISMIKVGN